MEGEEAESSSEEAETRDRTSSTPSTGSRELQLGASATNILSIDKVNLNDGKFLSTLSTSAALFRHLSLREMPTLVFLSSVCHLHSVP